MPPVEPAPKVCVVTLPWPDKALSPNARAHFMVIAAAKRDAKAVALWTAIESGIKFLAIERHPVLTWRFYPPIKRRRDQDNINASMKAYADGISAAMQIDDSRFEMRYMPICEVREGGAVEVTIHDAPA
jgi:hypothetical protein